MSVISTGAARLSLPRGLCAPGCGAEKSRLGLSLQLQPLLFLRRCKPRNGMPPCDTLGLHPNQRPFLRSRLPHNHHSTKGFRVQPGHQVDVPGAVLFPQLTDLNLRDAHVFPNFAQVPTVECPTKCVNSSSTLIHPLPRNAFLEHPIRQQLGRRVAQGRGNLPSVIDIVDHRASAALVQSFQVYTGIQRGGRQHIQ